MSDVQRIVETVFETVDRASGPMNAIATQASSLSSTLIAAVAGFASFTAVSSLMELHGQAEDTAGVLGGMFQTFGQVDNFNAGLQLAAETMTEIESAAAALPGEAQDYVNTFQTGFANFSQAFNGSIEKATKFSNQITAVASALSVPADQIARDVARLTQAGQGGAGADVLTWQRLMPYVNAYREQMHQTTLSAGTFNKMTQQSRTELLNNVVTMNSLSSVIDHASNSWGAMTGGFQSAVKQILKLATAPLFEEAKNQLHDINALLMDDEGHLTGFAKHIVDIGKNISEFIVDKIQLVHGWIEKIIEGVQKINLGKITEHLNLDSIAKLIPILSALKGFMSFGPLGGLAMLGGGELLREGGTDAIAPIVEKLSEVLGGLIDKIYPVVMSLMELAATIMDTLMPTVMELAGFIGDVIDIVADLLNDIFIDATDGAKSQLAGMASALTEVVAALREILPVIGTLLKAYLQMQKAIQDAVAWINRTLHTEMMEGFDALKAATTADFWKGDGPSLEQTLADMNNAANGQTQVYDESHSATSGFIANIWGAATSAEGIHDALQDGIKMYDVMKEKGWEWIHMMGYATQAVDATAMAFTGAGGGVAGMLAGINTIDFGKLAEDMKKQGEEERRRRLAPGARGGHHTVNDFRNSRFDITQKFAEGFDPDRIALAFTDDLERVSNQKLQSGLEPAFGVN